MNTEHPVWKIRRRTISTIALIGVVLTAVALGVASYRSEPVSEQTEAAGVLPEPSKPVIEPLEGPIKVVIQPGHWKIDELPAEAARRERGIGAVHGDVRELDINLAVVAALEPLLAEEGWDVMVIPATVPPGLRADAFLSIHADWGGDPERRGWKLAPPWRPSRASTALANALKESFRSESTLREDVGGVTVGMRGYFGFSPHRYLHATSPYTPAVLVELGFVTNARDRDLMLNDPGFYARIIHRGLVDHFATVVRSDVDSLIPRDFGIYAVGSEGAGVYPAPDREGAVVRLLSPGVRVRPVDETEEFFEVMVRDPRRIGYVAKADLTPWP